MIKDKGTLVSLLKSWFELLLECAQNVKNSASKKGKFHEKIVR